ncbi:MAG: ATP-binding protein [Variibacter sp.]
MRTNVILSWSSGKDCAWALHVLRQRSDVTVAGLVTTVNEAFGRVAMHGVRIALARRQAEAAGLSLDELALPWPCPNETYERIMADYVARKAAEGVGAFAFGDLFLEDIRHYREEKLAAAGMKALFPLWGLDTKALARDMIAAGLDAHIVCLDPRKLSSDFAGRRFDRSLLTDLPAGIDPCGENGEFHTFACAGPMFVRPIAVQRGEAVERDGFVFCDLVPTETEREVVSAASRVAR